MTALSQTVLEDYQVRKSKKQKKRFLQLLQESYPDIRVENGAFGSKNLILGDIEKAKVIYSAHYDTCAVLPFPNFISIQNMGMYILYTFAVYAGMVAVALAVTFLIGLLPLPGALLDKIWGITIWVLLLLMLFGPANRHTANDNTSGVVTLLEILGQYPEGLPPEVAVVFFDNEEAGLLGSRSFLKAHREVMKRTLLVNFDCVSDGDNMVLVTAKNMPVDYRENLARAFRSRGNKAVLHLSAGKAFYPSDQMSYPLGVGVAALHRKKGIGLYLTRIHTPKDTVFDLENIALLTEGAMALNREITA